MARSRMHEVRLIVSKAFAIEESKVLALSKQLTKDCLNITKKIMRPENEGSRVWFVSIVIIIASITLCGALFFHSSETVADLKQAVGEVAELRSVINAQTERLNAIQKALDRQQAEIDQMSFNGARNGDLNGSEMDPAKLGNLISDTAVAQSNLVVLVNRLLQKTSITSSPAKSPEEKRQAYAALQATADKQMVELGELKQGTADLLAQLRVPDDVSVLDPDRALDMLSLRSYWPYFEAKRKRDAARRIADSIEMKMMQEAINLNVAEQAGR